MIPPPASAEPAGGSFSLVWLADGTATLRSLEMGETFHPVIGPAAEAALHIQQTRIAERAAMAAGAPFVVWDIGLGAAANALAAIEALEGCLPPGHRAEVASFDLDERALRFALECADGLDYLDGHRGRIEALLADGETNASGIHWRFMKGDVREALRDGRLPAPCAVLFDPYSPSANPELWTVEVFAAILGHARRGGACLLSNYSRSTAVRSSLLAAGWFVGRGAASGQKTETTVAATHRSLLANPLDAGWLARLARSTAPGPLHADGRPSLCGSAVAQSLMTHPQFASE